MNNTDPDYLEEREQERRVNMSICNCSECDPDGAIWLVEQLPYTCDSEFDALISSQTRQRDRVENSLNTCPIESRSTVINIKLPVCFRKDIIQSQEIFSKLHASLMDHFYKLFHNTYPQGSELRPEHLFNQQHAWNIVKNHAGVLHKPNLAKLIGSEAILGTFSMILNCIQTWKCSQGYLAYIEELADSQITQEQSVLDGIILEQEQQEHAKIKALEKAKIDVEVVERKRIRLEKLQAKRTKAANQKERKRKRTKEDALALAGFKLTRAREAAEVRLIFSFIIFLKG